MRGKENLVLVRAAKNGLMLHTMYFADEVRSFDEIAKGETAKIGSAETNLALRLVDELSNEEFDAEKYEDQYRQRVMELVATKAEGKDITVAAPQAKRAQVIDLMAALKESLGRKSNLKGRKPAIRAKASQAGKRQKKSTVSQKMNGSPPERRRRLPICQALGYVLLCAPVLSRPPKVTKRHFISRFRIYYF